MKAKIFDVIRLILFIPMFFISLMIVNGILTFLFEIVSNLLNFEESILLHFVNQFITYLVSFIICLIIYPYENKKAPFVILLIMCLVSLGYSIYYFQDIFENIESISDLLEKPFFKLLANLTSFILVVCLLLPTTYLSNEKIH